MKKFVVLVLALLLCMSSVSAFAAGKLSVVQENYYTIEGYSTYGYGYAKVQNIGDKPIKVNAGLLEIFDENGDPITSTDYMHKYAEYLEPNEYTYAYLSAKVEGEAIPDDYMMTITGKSNTDYVTLRLPVETDYEEDVEVSKYTTHDYMYAMVTNDSEETVFDMEVVLTLLDDSDNILYMESSSLYQDKGLMPGSSMMIRVYVPSDFVEYFEKNGITPSKVDAIAYVNLEQ